MSNHKITIGDASVTFEQVEVELDYSDILENIDDTITQRVSDQIGDEAWDAVEHQVDDTVRIYVNDREADVAPHLMQLLNDFNALEVPCSLAVEFIEAVQKALTWDGEQFHDGPSMDSIDYDWLHAAIAKEIRVQMHGLLHKMAKELRAHVD